MDDRHSIRSRVIENFNTDVNIKVEGDVFYVTKQFYLYMNDEHWLYERDDVRQPWKKCEKVIFH